MRGSPLPVRSAATGETHAAQSPALRPQSTWASRARQKAWRARFRGSRAGRKALRARLPGLACDREGGRALSGNVANEEVKGQGDLGL